MTRVKYITNIYLSIRLYLKNIFRKYIYKNKNKNNDKNGDIFVEQNNLKNPIIIDDFSDDDVCAYSVNGDDCPY